jgi:hypothetical protein
MKLTVPTFKIFTSQRRRRWQTLVMMTTHSPFQSQLFTNFVPTDKDREQIRSLCIEPLQELERLDAAIQRLTERRNELKTFIDAHHALLSPIRRLSPEVLQTIFVACLSRRPDYPVLDSSDVPLLLGRVCSGWRKIAYGCAELWASLHIAIPDPRTSDEEALLHRLRLEATTEWLARSGALPLHISISGKRSGRITNAEQCDWVTPYAKALLHFASRWMALEVAVPLHYLHPWSNLTGQQVPLLRNIRILSTEVTWKSTAIFTRSPKSLDFLSQASLDSLHIPHLNEVPKFNKGSLTNLTVTNAQSFANTEEMVSFFSGFSNLKKLYFSFHRLCLSLSQPSAQTFALPYLEDLWLQQQGEATLLVAFWEAFHLPELRHMTCTLPSPLPRNITAFGQLVNGSSQCFSLAVHINDNWTEAVDGRSGTWWSSEDLASYLRQCPNVTKLSVTCSSSTKKGDQSKSAGECLCQAIFLEGDGFCLPHLETLNISLLALPLVKNTTLLHQALSSRARRARDHPEICVPLRSLTIDVHYRLPRDLDITAFSSLQNYGTSFAALFPQNIGKVSGKRTSAFDKGWTFWKEAPKLKFP